MNFMAFWSVWSQNRINWNWIVVIPFLGNRTEKTDASEAIKKAIYSMGVFVNTATYP